MKLKLYLLYFWTAIVLIAIAWPVKQLDGDLLTWQDKIAHAFLFGIFAFLLALVLDGKQKFKINKILVISAAGGCAYSLLGEFIQIFVPGRTVSELDFLAGIAGIIFMLLIFYGTHRNKKA